MALLALAIAAIGWSSPVFTQQASQQAGRGENRATPQRTSKWPTAFIVVLRDGEAQELAVEQQAVQQTGSPCGTVQAQPSYEEGCGLNRFTGEVYSASGQHDCPSSQYGANVAEAWRPAVLPIACDTSGLFTSAAEGLTQYDATYDRAMSVEADSSSVRQAIERLDPECEDQQLLLFQSLCTGETTQSLQISPAAGQRLLRWDGVINGQAVSSAIQLGRAAILGAKFWAWIKAKQAAVAPRDTARGGLVAFWSPPQSQLLQIAVATLNRVAELLPSAIERWHDQGPAVRAVQRPAGPFAAQPK